MSDFDMPPTGTWEVRGGWVVRELAKDAGLTLEQAAGLVGNLGYESNGFKTLQEIAPMVAGSKGGWGWGQWTASRRTDFERRVAEKGYDPRSDEANYDFLLFELLGNYRVFAARLRQMHSIEDACRLAHEQYERPSDVLDGSYRSGPDRLLWARRALKGARAIQSGDATPAAPTEDPVDLCRRMQRALSVEDDADPGPATRAAMKRWRAAHPG